MSKMTDHQRALFLRAAGLEIGHTDGQPFGAGCVRLDIDNLNNGWITLRELEDLIRHFDFAAHCGRCFVPSAADRFVFRLLKDNRVFDAWAELREADRDAEAEM